MNKGGRREKEKNNNFKHDKYTCDRENPFLWQTHCKIHMEEIINYLSLSLAYGRGIYL